MILNQFKTFRTQALIAGLLPAIALAVPLITYLINTQLDNLFDAFNERGQAIANEAAALSTTGLFTRDSATLKTNLKSIFRHSDVSEIRVLDESNNTLAKINSHSNNPMAGNINSTDNHIIFRAHVGREIMPIDVSDYPEQSEEPEITALSGTTSLGSVAITISTKRLLANKRRIMRNSLLILWFGLIGTILFSLALSKRVTGPISRLTKAVVKMRAGDFSTLIPEKSYREIASLEESFNTMARELKLSQETMQQQINQATSDLTQTMEALEIQNVELDLARKRALMASHVKSEFLANMSHEIRTPMNGVLGFANLLKKMNLDKKQKDVVNTITKSATNLLEIINHILDYSKLEYGRLEPDSSSFSVTECFEDPVVLLAPSAQDKELELVLMVYSDVPDRLIGDLTRIRQILVNLLSNAIKFTHTGEVIVRVMLERETDSECTLSFTVTDTGIGIDHDAQEHLFRAFQQADTSTSRMYGGTGLGLSISRKLAQSMGGSIKVDSARGQGSCFRVTLTLKKDDTESNKPQSAQFYNKSCLIIDQHKLSRLSIKHQFLKRGFLTKDLETVDTDEPILSLTDLIVCGFTKDEITSGYADITAKGFLTSFNLPVLVLLSASDRNTIENFHIDNTIWSLSKPLGSETLDNILKEIFSAGEAHDHSTIASNIDSDTSLKGKRILVVDDNHINLELMNILLSEKGAIVSEANIGSEAIDLATKNQFDLILMDVHMPKLKGTDAAKRILENCANRSNSPPIVALTADVVPETRNEVIAAGMDGYLLKPYTESQLMNVILPLLRGEKPQLAQTMATTNESVDSDADLPIRDEEKALNIAGGNKKLVDEMFKQFCNELPEQAGVIRGNHAARQWDDLRENVHRLHGATSICGVPALNLAVTHPEAASKSRDEAKTLEKLQRFNQEVGRLLDFRDRKQEQHSD
ncbi:MAG: hypothetical protein DIZ78_04100 [endosymbiont of Escarpia spicata]|uniref:histidine kinase n=1 Tax=endosymbiont of Escarpia spicata TaxID=2200908 RepID=A0A370DRM5_9GAMM|nr:MAG: hypothetical protein DIZ78_04100 [endosymbiont of Escarpia spicata]